MVLASKASKNGSRQGDKAEGCHELLKVGFRVPDMPDQRDDQTRNLGVRVILDENQRDEGLVLASFFMIQVLHACLGVFRFSAMATANSEIFEVPIDKKIRAVICDLEKPLNVDSHLRWKEIEIEHPWRSQ
jgi:hypothetical protein